MPSQASVCQVRGAAHVAHGAHAQSATRAAKLARMSQTPSIHLSAGTIFSVRIACQRALARELLPFSLQSDFHMAPALDVHCV